MVVRYQIRYDELAAKEIEGLGSFDARKIVGAIEQHLRHGPKTESKSRFKKMRQPFWNAYRLRVDDFRVYDDVDDAEHAVYVLRVLHKTSESTPGEPP